MTKLTIEEQAARDTASAIETGRMFARLFDEMLIPRKRPPDNAVPLRTQKCSVEGCNRRFASSEARIQHYRDVHE